MLDLERAPGHSVVGTRSSASGVSTMNDMPSRHLGELAVSAQGLGCMGMSHGYGASDDEQSIATLHHALDLGVTFVDTADFYGAGHNEELLGRALADRRDDV